MRNILLLILIQFLCVYAKSQRPDYTIKYFPAINKAELSIVAADYSQALGFYQQAFREVPRAFAKDMLNATVCAIKTNNYELAYSLCDSLISKGVSKEFLSSFQGLAPLRMHSEWKSYFDLYDSTYAFYKSRKKVDLELVFEKIRYRDQEFRFKPGSYKTFKDSIRYNDSLNTIDIKRIIAEHGFPNEDFADKPDPRNIYFPGYIYFHHQSQALSRPRSKSYNYIKEFTEAVRNGQLDPYRFAYLLVLQKEPSLDLGGFGVSVCKLGYKESPLLGEIYSPKRFATIEHHRNNYGLCTLEEYYKKAVFALRNEEAKDFAFKAFEHLNVFEVGDGEEFENFVNASILIEGGKG